MSLELKSQELKELVSTYDTDWFLGDLSGLMKSIARGGAQDQLGNLSSPMRQLYFLAGLLMTSDPSNGVDIQYDKEKWDKIVVLLNEIEREYDKLFFPKAEDEVDEEWKKVRSVAMPSFLAYFNQGPLNYEEQIINWVRDLYLPLDNIIEEETGLKVEQFIKFYETIDNLIQKKFQGFASPKGQLDKRWLDYTKIKMGVVDEAPDFIKKMGEKNRPLYTFMADHGIINRFAPEDIVSDELTLEEVNTILKFLASEREQGDFLYYTSTKPGNPLYEKPIVKIDNDMYQVFEVKQIMHSIENLLESVCTKTKANTSKLVDKKGKLLEDRVLELFKKFFKDDYTFHVGYYVDGCEQDILFLWKNYAFIIEAKGYNLREPLRDPNKAFVRIKDDFKSSIGYGYEQCKRVAQKFINHEPLLIKDKNGNIIDEIDTSKYDNRDFSIIVNLKSFGQIQNDLSTLLDVEEDDAYPWAVRLDDLEVFILTMIKHNKNPDFFIDFLVNREELHGKLICSDELEICGGYLTGVLSDKKIENSDIIFTTPDLANVFDKQYFKEMGFENEKYLYEKRSGKFIFF